MALTFGVSAVKTAVVVVGIGPIGGRIRVNLESVASDAERYWIFFDVLLPSKFERVDP